MSERQEPSKPAAAPGPRAAPGVVCGPLEQVLRGRLAVQIVDPGLVGVVCDFGEHGSEDKAKADRR
jgi:hypothetical protein